MNDERGASMARSRRIACAVVVISIISTVVSVAAWAADAAPKFGVVDMVRLYKESPRVKQYKEELDKLTQTLGESLNIRGRNLMLDETSVKELIELKTKAPEAQTDKDKARITELEKIGHDLDSELIKLQGTAQLDDAGKAKLKDLQDINKKSKDTGEKLEKDYNDRLQTKAVELDEKARVDIQAAVEKVAKDKEVTLVVTKDAVLFGGIDITDDVMNNLDRKVQ